MSKKTTTKKTAAKTTKATKATPKKSTKTPAKKREGKMSALDAAVQVLADSKEPLNTKAMIEQMAAKRLWTSPGGKTPHAYTAPSYGRSPTRARTPGFRRPTAASSPSASSTLREFVRPNAPHSPRRGVLSLSRPNDVRPVPPGHQGRSLGTPAIGRCDQHTM